MARAVYEDRYAIGLQSAFKTADGCTNTVDSTTGDERSGVLTNDQAPAGYGVTVIDTNKTTGSASRRAGTGAEYQQGTEAPTVAFPFDISAKAAYPFFRVAFQTGSLEQDTTAPTESKWFYPASEGGLEAVEWLTVVKDYGSGNSERFIGGVAESLEINAEVSGALNMTANLIGYDEETGHTLTNENFDYNDEALLLWQNAKVAMSPLSESAALGAGSVVLPGFSVTLNTGATPKHFNSKNPERIILNEFTGDGTINPPWNLGYTALENDKIMERFIAEEPMIILVYWDSDTVPSPYPNANNQLAIAMCVRASDATVGGDDELETEVPFELIEFPIMSGNGVSGDVITGWSVSSADVTVTVDHTNTSSHPYNLLYPGYRFIAHDADTNSERLHIVRDVQFKMPYDVKSDTVSGFTAGEIIEGGTSGFTAVVEADDNPTSAAGNLSIRHLYGVAQENEQITGQTSGVTANVNFAAGIDVVLTVKDSGNAPTSAGGGNSMTIYAQPAVIGLYDSLDRSIE